MTEQQQKTFARLLALWALLMGAVVRLTPALLGRQPVLDGGLFYAMVHDLRAAHYALPPYTYYNAAQIPMAYPPLPFYLAGLLGDLFRIPTLELFCWLPAIYSIFTLAAFYVLARLIIAHPLKAALATVAFAMTPATYDLFIQGGGVTRGLGSLFALLTLASVYRLYTRRRHADIAYTAVCAGLLVLSHPEVTFHTVFVVALLWLFLGRDRQTLGASLAVAAGVLLIAAPWWSSVIIRHGFRPFFATLGTGWHNWTFWGPLLRLDFAHEFFFSLITVLGLLGFLASVLQRSYLLPVWLLLPFVAEPRNPYFTAMVPLTLLAAIGLHDVVLPGLGLLERRFKGLPLPTGDTSATTPLAFRLGVGVFLAYTLINAYAFSLDIARYRVTDDERAALTWIAENTPDGAQVLMLTYGDPFNTPVQEWFPALTGRISLTTVQGYEWLPGQLYARKAAFESLQPCLFADLACVERWAADHGLEYDYLYLYQGFVGGSAGEPGNRLATLVLRDLQTDAAYQPLYQQADIYIFRHHLP